MYFACGEGDVMQHRRVVLSLAATLVFTAALLLSLPAAAPAQIDGPCTVTMNGVSADSLAKPANALQVPYNGAIDVEVVSDDTISRHEVRLEFIGGAPWTISEKDDDSNTWSGTESVAKYSRYGVGLYRVTGESYGAGACSGSAYIKVTGKNPLTTPVGIGGAAATALGVAGVAGAGLFSGNKAPSLARRIAEGPTQTQATQVDEDAAFVYMGMLHCLTLAPLALLTTGAYMLAGAGGVGGPAVMLRWRPYLSVISLTGSLLAGLGTLVLAQQFALFFPTITLLVVWLLGWLAVGVVIPSLAHLSSVRKANDILKYWASEGGVTPEEGKAMPEEGGQNQ
ncbi:MAG: hypothetical protein C4534_10005 [Gaiellales bacterium]|nr:MAG: hypothetical protein C4534_10005 [Gaiellales bacterium]